MKGKNNMNKNIKLGYTKSKVYGLCGVILTAALMMIMAPRAYADEATTATPATETVTTTETPAPTAETTTETPATTEATTAETPATTEATTTEKPAEAKLLKRQQQLNKVQMKHQPSVPVQLKSQKRVIRLP